MEEELFSILNSITKTYPLQAPVNNTEYPLIIYNFFEGYPELEGDNTYFSKTYYLQIDYYSKTKDYEVIKQIEKQLKGTYDFIRVSPFLIDEDKIIRTRFEYSKTYYEEEI